MEKIIKTLKKEVITVKVSNDFYNQFSYVCQQIPKVEWSGVLFYKVVGGSIQSPETLILEPITILTLDMGTAAHTDFQYDERVIDFIMENPEISELQMGLIHSHNTMGTFFSGTDVSELEDNFLNHNIYFSFIVNNFGDMCAKVAHGSKLKNTYTSITLKDTDGNSYQQEFKYDELVSVMYVYDCLIQYEGVKLTAPSHLQESVKKVMIPKPTPHIVSHHNPHTTPYQPSFHNPYHHNPQLALDFVGGDIEEMELPEVVEEFLLELVCVNEFSDVSDIILSIDNFATMEPHIKYNLKDWKKEVSKRWDELYQEFFQEPCPFADNEIVIEIEKQLESESTEAFNFLRTLLNKSK